MKNYIKLFLILGLLPSCKKDEWTKVPDYEELPALVFGTKVKLTDNFYGECEGRLTEKSTSSECVIYTARMLCHSKEESVLREMTIRTNRFKDVTCEYVSRFETLD